MKMVPSAFARDRVGVVARGREHPLPRPFSVGIRIFLSERVRQLDLAQTPPQVVVMLAFHGKQMRSKRLSRRRGQHREAILVALSGADDDLIPVEVDVLHAQAAAFEEPQLRIPAKPITVPGDADQQSGHADHDRSVATLSCSDFSFFLPWLNIVIGRVGMWATRRCVVQGSCGHGGQRAVALSTVSSRPGMSTRLHWALFSFSLIELPRSTNL